jgi:hypothetical protein
LYEANLEHLFKIPEQVRPGSTCAAATSLIAPPVFKAPIVMSVNKNSVLCH